MPPTPRTSRSVDILRTTQTLREGYPGPRPDYIHTEVVSVKRQGQRPPMVKRSDSTTVERNYASHWLEYETLPINGFRYAATLKDGTKVTLELVAATFRDAFLAGRQAVAKKAKA